jgi:hypothetical protein
MVNSLHRIHFFSQLSPFSSLLSRVTDTAKVWII